MGSSRLDVTARGSFLQRPFRAEPMVLIDPESSRSDRTSPADVGSTQSPAPNAPEPPSGKLSRLLVFAVVAGLSAGVGSMLVGEAIVSRYQSDLVPALKAHPSAEDIGRFKDARLYSAVLTFTAMGGILGLAMGLAGGMARQSAFASVSAAIFGLMLGTAASGSTALALVSSFYKKHDPQSGELMLPLLTHGAIWSAMGAIGGLAFGLGLGGRGRWKATLIGGLVGAGAAAIVYEIVGALAFPTSKTDLPLSSSLTTREMAQLLVAILSAVGAVVALRPSAKTEPSSSPSS
jgi:hypothetical protein